LIFTMTPFMVTIVFLIAYPIVISRGKASKKIAQLLSGLIDSYIRIIIEIFHNIGFIFTVISKSFYRKLEKQNEY
jgi:hypothetical protein